MKSIIKHADLSFTAADQPRLTLTLTLPRKDAQTAFQSLQEVLKNGKQLECEITQRKRKRSLDSNSYCWVLCQKIAEVTGSTKELIYQEFIRRVGQFEIVPIKDEAVNRWIEVWKGKGLGWYAEVLEDSKLPGYKKVISYYGSSCYNQQEMSVLLNEIVSQCHELGISTMTPQELESLKNSWKGVG